MNPNLLKQYQSGLKDKKLSAGEYEELERLRAEHRNSPTTKLYNRPGFQYANMGAAYLRSSSRAWDRGDSSFGISADTAGRMFGRGGMEALQGGFGGGVQTGFGLMGMRKIGTQRDVDRKEMEMLRKMGKGTGAYRVTQGFSNLANLSRTIMLSQMLLNPKALGTLGSALFSTGDKGIGARLGTHGILGGLFGLGKDMGISTKKTMMSGLFGGVSKKVTDVTGSSLLGGLAPSLTIMGTLMAANLLKNRQKAKLSIRPKNVAVEEKKHSSTMVYQQHVIRLANAGQLDAFQQMSLQIGMASEAHLSILANQTVEEDQSLQTRSNVKGILTNEYNSKLGKFDRYRNKSVARKFGTGLDVLTDIITEFGMAFPWAQLNPFANKRSFNYLREKTDQKLEDRRTQRESIKYNVSSQLLRALKISPDKLASGSYENIMVSSNVGIFTLLQYMAQQEFERSRQKIENNDDYISLVEERERLTKRRDKFVRFNPFYKFTHEAKSDKRRLSEIDKELQNNNRQNRFAEADEKVDRGIKAGLKYTGAALPVFTTAFRIHQYLRNINDSRRDPEYENIRNLKNVRQNRDTQTSLQKSTSEYKLLDSIDKKIIYLRDEYDSFLKPKHIKYEELLTNIDITLSNNGAKTSPLYQHLNGRFWSLERLLIFIERDIGQLKTDYWSFLRPTYIKYDDFLTNIDKNIIYLKDDYDSFLKPKHIKYEDLLTNIDVKLGDTGPLYTFLEYQLSNYKVSDTLSSFMYFLSNNIGDFKKDYDAVKSIIKDIWPLFQRYLTKYSTKDEKIAEMKLTSSSPGVFTGDYITTGYAFGGPPRENLDALEAQANKTAKNAGTIPKPNLKMIKMGYAGGGGLNALEAQANKTAANAGTPSPDTKMATLKDIRGYAKGGFLKKDSDAVFIKTPNTFLLTNAINKKNDTSNINLKDTPSKDVINLDSAFSNSNSDNLSNESNVNQINLENEVNSSKDSSLEAKIEIEQLKTEKKSLSQLINMNESLKNLPTLKGKKEENKSEGFFGSGILSMLGTIGGTIKNIVSDLPGILKAALIAGAGMIAWEVVKKLLEMLGIKPPGSPDGPPKDPKNKNDIEDVGDQAANLGTNVTNLARGVGNSVIQGAQNSVTNWNNATNAANEAQVAAKTLNNASKVVNVTNPGPAAAQVEKMATEMEKRAAAAKNLADKSKPNVITRELAKGKGFAILRVLGWAGLAYSVYDFIKGLNILMQTKSQRKKEYLEKSQIAKGIATGLTAASMISASTGVGLPVTLIAGTGAIMMSFLDFYFQGQADLAETKVVLKEAQIEHEYFKLELKKAEDSLKDAESNKEATKEDIDTAKKIVAELTNIIKVKQYEIWTFADYVKTAAVNANLFTLKSMGAALADVPLWWASSFFGDPNISLSRELYQKDVNTDFDALARKEFLAEYNIKNYNELFDHGDDLYRIMLYKKIRDKYGYKHDNNVYWLYANMYADRTKDSATNVSRALSLIYDDDSLRPSEILPDSVSREQGRLILEKFKDKFSPFPPPFYEERFKDDKDYIKPNNVTSNSTPPPHYSNYNPIYDYNSTYKYNYGSKNKAEGGRINNYARGGKITGGEYYATGGGNLAKVGPIANNRYYDDAIPMPGSNFAEGGYSSPPSYVFNAGVDSASAQKAFGKGNYDEVNEAGKLNLPPNVKSGFAEGGDTTAGSQYMEAGLSADQAYKASENNNKLLQIQIALNNLLYNFTKEREGRTPYKWRGTDADRGTDCSGYTSNLMYIGGKNLNAAAGQDIFKYPGPNQRYAVAAETIRILGEKFGMVKDNNLMNPSIPTGTLVGESVRSKKHGTAKLFENIGHIGMIVKHPETGENMIAESSGSRGVHVDSATDWMYKSPGKNAQKFLVDPFFPIRKNDSLDPSKFVSSESFNGASPGLENSLLQSMTSNGSGSGSGSKSILDQIFNAVGDAVLTAMGLGVLTSPPGSSGNSGDPDITSSDYQPTGSKISPAGKLTSNIADVINKVAGEVGLAPAYFAALTEKESTFNPAAVANAGSGRYAYGLTQLLDWGDNRQGGGLLADLRLNNLHGLDPESARKLTDLSNKEQGVFNPYLNEKYTSLVTKEKFNKASNEKSDGKSPYWWAAYSHYVGNIIGGKSDGISYANDLMSKMPKYEKGVVGVDEQQKSDTNQEEKKLAEGGSITSDELLRKASQDSLSKALGEKEFSVIIDNPNLSNAEKIRQVMLAYMPDEYENKTLDQISKEIEQSESKSKEIQKRLDSIDSEKNLDEYNKVYKELRKQNSLSSGLDSIRRDKEIMRNMDNGLQFTDEAYSDFYKDFHNMSWIEQSNRVSLPIFDTNKVVTPEGFKEKKYSDEELEKRIYEINPYFDGYREDAEKIIRAKDIEKFLEDKKNQEANLEIKNNFSSSAERRGVNPAIKPEIDSSLEIKNNELNKDLSAKYGFEIKQPDSQQKDLNSILGNHNNFLPDFALKTEKWGDKSAEIPNPAKEAIKLSENILADEAQKAAAKKNEDDSKTDPNAAASDVAASGGSGGGGGGGGAAAEGGASSSGGGGGSASSSGGNDKMGSISQSLIQLIEELFAITISNLKSKFNNVAKDVFSNA
jgi:hypothetical protein